MADKNSVLTDIDLDILTNLYSRDAYKTIFGWSVAREPVKYTELRRDFQGVTGFYASLEGLRKKGFVKRIGLNYQKNPSAFYLTRKGLGVLKRESPIESRLEKIAASILLFFGVGLLFSKLNLTGRVISEAIVKSNFLTVIGVVMIFIGLLILFKNKVYSTS